TQDFAAMSPSAKPAGDVVLTGKLHYRNNPSRPAVRNAAIEGQIASELLTAVASGRRVDVHKLHGNYQLADGAFRATGVGAGLLGGQINTDVEMRNLDNTPSSRVRAELRDISLQAAKRVAERPELNRVSVTGSLSGKVNAAWAGNVSSVRAHSDLFVRAATK